MHFYTLPTIMQELSTFLITRCALRDSALTNAIHTATMCRDKSYAIVTHVQLPEWMSGIFVPAMHQVH